MSNFRAEQYLWIHLAGLAVLPIALEFTLLFWGLGEPFLPLWLEGLMVAIVGMFPIVWMQWQRPFYIFSLTAVALKPENLTYEQRQILSQFKAEPSRFWVLAAAGVTGISLVRLSSLLPLAAGRFPLLPDSHLLGLCLAGSAFLGANLFLQVPIGVLRILLLSRAQWQTTPAYPVEHIDTDFMVLGLKVAKLL